MENHFALESAMINLNDVPASTKCSPFSFENNYRDARILLPFLGVSDLEISFTIQIQSIEE